MQELAEAIRDNAREIIDHWDEHVKETEPYISLDTRDERLDHLVDMITTLAFASLPEQARDIHQKALYSAASHGTVRREQGFSAETILKEYYVLRHALWKFVQEHATDSGSATDAISRLDRATTLTSRASLLGLHRPELEKQGKWPKTLEDLLEQSPFLVVPEDPSKK